MKKPIKFKNQKDQLEGLIQGQFLNETEYREYKSKFGNVFKAGMGAEAFYDILKTMDLETLSRDLWREVRTSRSKQAAKRATAWLAGQLTELGTMSKFMAEKLWQPLQVVKLKLQRLLVDDDSRAQIWTAAGEPEGALRSGARSGGSLTWVWNGKRFRIYKFRIIVADAEILGGPSTALNDPRLTAIGKFLRKWNIDEFPQFFNVLKGEMSVVGPRPHRQWLTEEMKNEVQNYMTRHYLKPGITGWAQVNGRNAISWEEKFKLDVWYVDNWSFWLDIKIILMTLWKVIKREGISQPGHATAEEFMGSLDDVE